MYSYLMQAYANCPEGGMHARVPMERVSWKCQELKCELPNSLLWPQSKPVGHYKRDGGVKVRDYREQRDLNSDSPVFKCSAPNHSATKSFFLRSLKWSLFSKTLLMLFVHVFIISEYETNYPIVWSNVGKRIQVLFWLSRYAGIASVFKWRG